MSKICLNKKLISFFIIFFALSSCAKEGFFKTGDARKNPPDPKERIKKNLEEGRGFRLSNLGKQKGGSFDFASSNELWRASLDILDFMPLTSANYSGGIIITDWYSEEGNSNDSVKITIRFLSNEIRSDAVDIDVFYKNCVSIGNCSISKKDGPLKKELTKKILSKAAVYEAQNKKKNSKP
jgi:hypothetical protein